MRTPKLTLAAILTAAIATPAAAFTPKDAEPQIVVADDVRAPRTFRNVHTTVPLHASLAYDRVRAIGMTRSLWDGATGVPAQLWGTGIAVPGSVADAAIAEAAARRFLADHIDLLAPGASVSDFALLGNSENGGLRGIGFAQHYNGLRVVGASISFVFKADRMVLVTSKAMPDIAVAVTAPITESAVRLGAQSWVSSSTGRVAVAGVAATDRVVLPIVHGRGDIEYRVVTPVDVSLAFGIGRWDVFVDAGTGKAIARKSKIHFATGTITYTVPARYPGGGRQAFPAIHTRHTINGAQITSDAAGMVTWSGTAASTVSPGLVGPYVTIHNQAGAEATTTFTLQPNGTANWGDTAEFVEAQLTAQIHANLIKRYAKNNIAPSLSVLDQNFPVYVNEGGDCNAYSQITSIHFLQRSSQCENTALLADVVYHEFGHSLHGFSQLSGTEWDGALSEGVSDFLAANYTGDPGMGRGFFFSSQALRHIDPPGSEKVWPDDVVGQVHADGEIIGGTLWDLRKALVAARGESDGVAAMNQIFYGILQMSDDIPASFAAALIADDDDGNVDNGTPNECAIRGAFSLHGLSDMTVGSNGISRPLEDGLTISVTEQPPMGTCPAAAITSARLTWFLRETQNTNGMIDMTSADLGGGVTGWSAALPAQPDGTVINYKVDLTLADGMQISFPRNQADRYYEKFVGAVVPVWCDDFEAGADQWTHGADAGSDEWQVGASSGLAGDPTMAVSGTAVFGTDIRSNGVYAAQSNQWAKTPEIDTSMYPADSIRLQYRRWLNVEDGFWDTASISVDGAPRWSNLDSNQGNGSNTHHQDEEWRFHDVPLAAEAADNKVQIEFRLDTDEGLHFGGWTLDDVCIVARAPAGGVCGDGTVTDAEQCDDGNTTDGDGCSATCVDETGGGDEGGCCSTGSGPAGPMLLGMFTLGLVWRRRRK